MSLQSRFTDEQKLEKLNELGNMLLSDKAKNGKITPFMKLFSAGALKAIGECNESWCDNCKIREALGNTCDVLISEVNIELKASEEGKSYLLEELNPLNK